jgi:hypothetical protein
MPLRRPPGERDPWNLPAMLFPIPLVAGFFLGQRLLPT